MHKTIIMPTEYLPVSFLKKLRDQSIKKYIEENPKAPEAPTIKYSRGYDNFYKAFGKAVRRATGNLSWVPRFLNGTAEAEMIEAKIYNFDFSQAILSDIYQYVNGRPLTKAMCEYERQTVKLARSAEVARIKAFKDIEFKKSGIQIRCITSKLNWIDTHYEDAFKASSYKDKKDLHNSFKYILTTNYGDSVMAFIGMQMEKYQEGNGVLCDIEIKKVEPLFTSILPELSSNVLPLPEDFVIYSNLSEEASEAFGGYDSLLFRGIGELPDDLDRPFTDLIFSDQYKRDWIRWFETVWDKL